MKEVKKLNLRQSQMLSAEEQDVIIAGSEKRLMKIEGNCNCSWQGAHSHTITRTYEIVPTWENYCMGAFMSMVGTHAYYNNREDADYNREAMRQMSPRTEVWKQTYSAIFDCKIENDIYVWYLNGHKEGPEELDH